MCISTVFVVAGSIVVELVVVLDDFEFVATTAVVDGFRFAIIELRFNKDTCFSTLVAANTNGAVLRGNGVFRLESRLTSGCLRDRRRSPRNPDGSTFESELTIECLRLRSTAAVLVGRVVTESIELARFGIFPMGTLEVEMDFLGTSALLGFSDRCCLVGIEAAVLDSVCDLDLCVIFALASEPLLLLQLLLLM